MTRLICLAIIVLLSPLVLSQNVPETQDADLCKKVKCKKPRGAWCQVVEVDGVPKAKCVCPQTCEGEAESPVCSVFGKQYDNLCEFHKYACKKRRTIPIARHAECIASQEPCTNNEYSQFPFRLLEWFMHLREVDEFGQLNPNRRILSLTTEEKESVAMWKFDELDRNQDDILDKRELLRFRYALMPLEHCAEPFFSRCAKQDKDVKRITAREWVDCLKVYEVEELQRLMPQPPAEQREQAAQRAEPREWSGQPVAVEEDNDLDLEEDEEEEEL